MEATQQDFMFTIEALKEQREAAQNEAADSKAQVKRLTMVVQYLAQQVEELKAEKAQYEGDTNGNELPSGTEDRSGEGTNSGSGRKRRA